MVLPGGKEFSEDLCSFAIPLLAVHFHSAWMHLGIGSCLGGASHRRTENRASSLVSPRQSKLEIRPAGHVVHRICSFTWDLWCMKL